MTDTYRIKPQFAEVKFEIERAPFGDEWLWRLWSKDGRLLRGGKGPSLDSAKRYAAYAYSDLVTGALEPVETPTVPQNQS